MRSKKINILESHENYSCHLTGNLIWIAVNGDVVVLHVVASEVGEYFLYEVFDFRVGAKLLGQCITDFFWYMKTAGMSVSTSVSVMLHSSEYKWWSNILKSFTLIIEWKSWWSGLISLCKADSQVTFLVALTKRKF